MANRVEKKQNFSVKDAVCAVLTKFFEHLTHLILYERQVYNADSFKLCTYNNLPHPICCNPNVVSYIKRSISSTNRLLIDQYLKSYAITIKNKKNLTLEKFMFRIVSLRFPRKDEITNDAFTFLDNIARNFHSKLLFLKPCMSQNDDATFTIEFLSSDNILQRLPDDLEIVTFGLDTEKSIVPLCSVVSPYIDMEIYCEINTIG